MYPYRTPSVSESDVLNGAGLVRGMQHSQTRARRAEAASEAGLSDQVRTHEGPPCFHKRPPHHPHHQRIHHEKDSQDRLVTRLQPSPRSQAGEDPDQHGRSRSFDACLSPRRWWLPQRLLLVVPERLIRKAQDSRPFPRHPLWFRGFGSRLASGVDSMRRHATRLGRAQ